MHVHASTDNKPHGDHDGDDGDDGDDHDGNGGDDSDNGHSVTVIVVPGYLGSSAVDPCSTVARLAGPDLLEPV